MNHAYYEFISTQVTDEGSGAILRKHAGDFFWGLIKSSGVNVWESEKGCSDILKWAEDGIVKGDGGIARYNSREMKKALFEIRKLR